MLAVMAVPGLTVGATGMALSRQTNIAIPRKHYSDVLADAWCADDRQLAERFRRAMQKARSELPGGKFGAVLKRAWALDPDLRGQFGAAVSVGLRRMWSDAAVRAEQGKRIRRTYTQDLRKQRSEALKKNWANADFRAKMMGSSSRQADGRFGARGSV
jgi:GAF domain-containing protein